ncbi:MAG: HAMP domain-containing histidine kinase [Alphaproteobacteria bacterium]|nr:HAMP domain-containing histidine kinase [Alphaproteobacteria bacterium]
MAGHEAAAWPTAFLQGTLGKIAALPTRNIRATVLLCVIAIAGSFAAAGALQMRLDRAHAMRQASYFEARRARDIAAVIEANLQRQQRIARQLASQVSLDAPLPADIIGVAVSDRYGNVVRAAGAEIDMRAIAGAAQDGTVVLGTPGRTIMAFRNDGEIAALAFAPSALIPAGLTDDADVTGTAGSILAGTPTGSDAAVVPVGRWPVAVRVSLDDGAALAAWYGSLPLYLFVIIGPALVGAMLAAVFVREFERRAKASEAIRSLRSTRPAEARLLVRLANAEREAVEAHRSRSEFVAHMSHELRTPLNAVIGFAEVIERGFYGPVGHAKYIEYARDIGQAGRSLHAKIGDILEFANLEAGRYPLRPHRFDVTDVVASCVSESAGRAFSRRIDLDMVPSSPAQVIADPLAVRRIVTNLLSNALLYTPEGGRVRVTIREDEGAVAVTVSDSGKGFSPAEAEAAGTAFRRFERVGVSTGAGLGLAIVMGLARRMGGALKLSSAHGEGTSAELRLPKG